MRLRQLWFPRKVVKVEAVSVKSDEGGGGVAKGYEGGCDVGERRRGRRCSRKAMKAIKAMKGAAVLAKGDEDGD
jgi:hypothetical protein